MFAWRPRQLLYVVHFSLRLSGSGGGSELGGNREPLTQPPGPLLVQVQPQSARAIALRLGSPQHRGARVCRLRVTSERGSTLKRLTEALRRRVSMRRPSKRAVCRCLSFSAVLLAVAVLCVRAALE